MLVTIIIADIAFAAMVLPAGDAPGAQSELCSRAAEPLPVRSSAPP
jgi:hypothetical protein